jgi:dTDP-4-amino-4,6-dideoxygalactose transaminase
MYANHGALLKHHHKMEGTNSRFYGLQASILITKLSYILQWIEQRISLRKISNYILPQ